MTSWTYEVKTGKLFEPGGEHVATGYSGLGAAKNNPTMEQVEAQGPIPRGAYTIGAPYNSARVGPFALPLEPFPGTRVFGRSAFRIHGDSISHPGSASHGCIIISRAVREQIAHSGVTLLTVI